MMQTQWRVGMSGPTGLDYNTLFTFMTLMQVDYERHVELLEDIRTMEIAALNAIHKKD